MIDLGSVRYKENNLGDCSKNELIEFIKIVLEANNRLQAAEKDRIENSIVDQNEALTALQIKIDDLNRQLVTKEAILQFARSILESKSQY